MTYTIENNLVKFYDDSRFVASYPAKKMAMDAAKEYISNYPGRIARVLENINATGSYTSPVWVSVATLGV
jgi:hypothetical protein